MAAHAGFSRADLEAAKRRLGRAGYKAEIVDLLLALPEPYWPGDRAGGFPDTRAAVVEACSAAVLVVRGGAALLARDPAGGTVAGRPGDTAAPLWYQWYARRSGPDAVPVGDPVRVDVRPGDLYMPGDKAAGHDWREETTPTLRRAAGSPGSPGSPPG